MTEPRGVRFETDGPVGRIVLERPEAANSFDLRAAQAFGAVVDQAASTAVHALTITGDGRRFCTGGDVGSFAAAEDSSSYLHLLATELESHLRRLSELPKPVVAGVHGAVAGAGLSLLLNADLVIAGAGTKFVFAYGGIGLTPDCGVSWLLPRAVGQQRALEFALTGRVLTAMEAREWGLVTEVVDDDDVVGHTHRLARTLADGPTQAYGETRRLIRGARDTSRSANAKDEAETIARMVNTGDAQRLISQFIS